MKFTQKTEQTDFGTVWYYENEDGNVRFALYRYDDDLETIYLSNVHVDETSRRKGLGNRVLAVAEKQARKFDCDKVMLKVLVDSWMHEWYGRHGYSDLMFDEDDSYVWMEKTCK